MYINDTQHTVANSLREVRTAKGLTQDELATSVAATRQTIIAIEKGNYIPSVLLALRLAHTLQTSVEEIFRYEKI
ncbi:helix-turn-helix transcriptional regulator [soil metagenome]